MSDVRTQRDMLRRLEQTQVVERPGASGQTTFSASGVWTPTLVGLTIGGTFTYAATTAGNYTRIGNTVLIRGRITISAVAVAPTGNLTIQGLPIAAATVISGTAGGIQFVYWSLCNLGAANSTYLAGWIQNGLSRVDLATSQNNGGGAAFLTGAVAGVANGTDLLFTGQYQV